MATLLLSAAGAAIGGSFGGSVMGVAAGALGKAAGATMGALIDQRLTGMGSEAVESGRVERFRVMGASEGAALPRVFGRYRVAGQIVWSSRFLESVNTTRVGGKGGGRQSQKVKEFSYSISIAVAICEGEVSRVGRIWADGQRVDLSGVTWRLHHGSEDQLPDPLIAAIEGDDATPAYRGTAYVVFENLDLTPYGNRIPQFNFEVLRRPAEAPGVPRSPALDVRGVALVPGTGEYSLATTPVHVSHGKGVTVAANVNNDRGRADLVVSLEQMQAELPAAKAVSLVVSWFGDDLRCGACSLRPAVEQAEKDGQQMPWRVSGVGRFEAKLVSRVDGRPLFGGTPADDAVVEAIRHMRERGHSVMFYPFILMEVLADNALPDPWTGAAGQPPVPWRGRITLSAAPGRPDSPDQTPAAADEVAAFFGTARASDFRVEGGAVVYTGPQEWSYRRFILHYAHLCALAGGVSSFCIGSEMRGLTQIRDGRAVYPAVRALCALADEVRGVLGPGVKLGYAADWSEYFGHQPGDGSGDVMFHLDPLWAHPAIDFIGIDNYMPLSDWRAGSGHADAAHGSIYDLDYLKGNVAGGEGYDWYYADDEGRARQQRIAVADGAYGEDWTFRYKDIVGWWSNPHVNRVGGVKVGAPTSWVPRSKPIWFTELGCPAVDKGTNQPNVFHDPKSSESFFPYFSDGSSDRFIQIRYLQAMFAHWGDPDSNPPSDVYSGRMVDMDHAHVWAWDARPWPDFPDQLDVWVDGLNFELGHWINARAGLPSLAEIVAEVCARAGGGPVEVSALHGSATGYMIGSVESARQSLQPLMLTYGFDSAASDGAVAFASRSGRFATELSLEGAVATEGAPSVAKTRSAPTEAPGWVALEFVRTDADYQPGVAEAVAPQAAEPDVAQSSVPLVLSEGEARAVAERWLIEGQIARESVQFDLPPSWIGLTAGDNLLIDNGGRSQIFRIDRVEEFGPRSVTAVRNDPGLYDVPVREVDVVRAKPVRAVTPVHAEFLDLPLLTGDEMPHAPHVAVAKSPWAGSVAVYSGADDHGYEFNREIFQPATMGETLDPLARGVAGLWSPVSLRVRIASGGLQSRSSGEVLNGANAAALRFGGSGDWEVIQFSTAVLVGPGEYLLSGLLRGQAGTDAVIPDVWPAGSDFVLLGAGVVQLEMAVGARGLDRHFRIGPAVRPYDDASFVHSVERFAGVGLRPYRPAHLAADRNSAGDVVISWIRRTRIDGDSWEGSEAPLSEEREAYHVRVRRGGEVLREFTPAAPRQVYARDDRVSDGPGLVVEVAQISDRFGPGPYASIALAE